MNIHSLWNDEEIIESSKELHPSPSSSFVAFFVIFFILFLLFFVTKFSIGRRLARWIILWVALLKPLRHLRKGKIFTYNL